MLVGVGTTLAGAQAELVVQAKWREHPNRDAPEHVRDQTVGGTGTHRTGVGEEPE
ncbi:hypothetical protein HDA40_001988 [Hamadaea flava]|nr:hypothetical protein [Hamadaea flava]